MEVSLLEADGIPEGCLISVRAGSTRRQAPAEAGKPCKLWFPRGIQNANPFKVDLLAPLGSTVLEVGPNADSYPIEVKQRYGGSPMKVTLRVREETNENAAAPEIAFNSASKGAGNFAGIDSAIAGSGSNSESPARRHQMALEARSYLDQHNLLQFVQGLLQELIKDRPGDPWTYIDGRTEKMREKLGAKPEAPKDAGPPMTEIPKQPMPEPSKEVPTIEELRARAREALEGEVFRQKSAMVKQQREAEATDALRAKVSQSLAEASTDGRLGAAFAQLRKERDKVQVETHEVQAPPVQAPPAPSRAWIPHPCAFSGPMGMPGSMHGAPLFTRAVLSQPQTQPSTTKEPTTELTEPVAAGSTVLPVADTVGFAVGDPIFIESAAGEETNAIKGFGSLQLMFPLQFTHPVGTKIGKLPPDDPRVKLDRCQSPPKYTKERVTPGQSLHSMSPEDWSKVSSVIKRMPSEPTQESAGEFAPKEQATAQFDALPSVGTWLVPRPRPQRQHLQEEVQDAEQLRMRAKDALIKANEEGKLLPTKAEPIPFQALPSVCTWIGIQPRRRNPVSAEAPPPAQASSQTSGISSELRDQVKTALVTACMDGRLAAALHQEPGQVSRDDLVSQAREAIMGACVDGRLAEALKRVVPPEEAPKPTPQPAAQPASQPREVSEPAVSTNAASACTMDTESAVLRSSPSGPPPPKEPRCAQAAPPPNEAAAPPRHSPQMSSRSVNATPRPNERLSPLLSAPIVGGSSGIDAADAELKLRQRTERFKQENDALRKENARLKKLREAGDAAGMLCSENDRLRAELGKLLTMNKKEHPLRSKGAGSASCPKF